MESSLHANNITLTATLVVVLAATEAATFLVRDWQNRLYQRFAALSAAAVVANVGLALATLTQARGWHVVHLVGSVAAGPTSVLFFLELLGPHQPRGASLRPLLMPVGVALALLVIVSFNPSAPPLDVALYGPFLDPTTQLPLEPGGSAFGSTWWQHVPLGGAVYRTLLTHPAHYGIALLVGLYMFSCFLSILLNVLELRARAHTRTERMRLNLLVWLGVATVVGSILQSTGSYFRLPIGTYPLGSLAQVAFFVFIAQVIQSYRLLDLHEIVSRALIFASQVLIIGAFYSILLALFGDKQSWVNLGITIFLASGLVSAFHVPVAQALTRGINRLFFMRRFELMVRLHTLAREIPRYLAVRDVFKTLVQGLRETPQISHAAIFLWDERIKEYVYVDQGSTMTWPPMRKLAAASPLARELLHRLRPVSRDELERDLGSERGNRSDLVASLSNLKRLDADLTVPLAGDGVLFGFLALKDEALNEGFTNDELELLQQVADKASLIIQNSDAIQRLKERDRLAALGQMAAGLAHEIRNPLGAIRGAAQYLAEAGGTDPAEDREFLDIIVEEVDRLNLVVTDFLDYSRPLRLKLELRAPGEVVSQVAHLLEAQGLPEGVQLKLELAEGLEPIRMDVEKIKQVLINLAQNALQAMPAGGMLTLRTALAPRRPWVVSPGSEPSLEKVELQVVDTGTGIGPDALERLFIPFFTTKPRGTGLGLAISQRLVQAHDGELEVSSVEGQGTRFTVRLPVTPVGSAALEPGPSESALEPPAPFST